jgi:hypothetical protein
LDDQKSPESRRQLSPERPVCLMVEAENTEFDLDNTAGPSKKEPPGNVHAVMGGAIHSSQGWLTIHSSQGWLTIYPTLGLFTHFLRHSNTVLRTMSY